MAERLAGLATVGSYTVSGSSTLFGVYTANEIAAVGGLILGSLTFAVNWYYRHKLYQLEREKIHAAYSNKKSDEEEHRVT